MTRKGSILQGHGKTELAFLSHSLQVPEGRKKKEVDNTPGDCDF